MSDIENNSPVEAHGKNVVSMNKIAYLVWTYGLVHFRGSTTNPNDNNRYIQLLSDMTALERRTFWKRSINREMANAAVITHIDDDELYTTLERLLQDNLTRYSQNNDQ